MWKKIRLKKATARAGKGTLRLKDIDRVDDWMAYGWGLWRKKVARSTRVVFLVLLVIAIVYQAFLERWRGIDWFLWPLDNVVRVIDIADVMQTFDWQLHGVKMSYWTTSVSIALKLAIAVYIWGWITYRSLVILEHRGLQTVDDLALLLEDKDPATQRAAAQALGNMGPEASTRCARAHQSPNCICMRFCSAS